MSASDNNAPVGIGAVSTRTQDLECPQGPYSASLRVRYPVKRVHHTCIKERVPGRLNGRYGSPNCAACAQTYQVGVPDAN